MKNFKLYITLLFAVILGALSSGVKAQTSCGPFNSIMNFNNGQDGNMFMITAVNSIRVDSFWCNFDAGTIQEVEIWYRTGNFVGFQNSAVGWTLIDSVTNLTSAGTNSFTKVPIFVDIEIQAGCSVSFYVTRAWNQNVGPYMRYTNGPGGATAGQNYSTGTDLILSYAYGKDYPFGGTFNPRIWNGRIHYSCVPNSVPAATYNNIPATACPGDTVCYQITPGSGMPAGSWSWNAGQSGTIQSANNDSSTICVAFNGNVVFDTICLTLEGGCENVDTCFPITINPPFAEAGPDTIICSTTYPLNGNQAAGFWEVVTGAGTFADPTVYNTVVSGLAPGVNQFRWNVATQNCDTIFDEVTVTVSPIPVAQFDAPNGCAEGPIPFTDNSYALAGNIISWAWDVDGDGTDDYTTNSFNHSYPSAGTYQARLVVTANGLGGCTDTLIKPIVAAPNPQVDWEYDAECEGNPMSFTDLTTISSGDLEDWLWEWGDGTNPSIAQNAAHIFASDGIYIVTLTVTSDSGCEASLADSVEVFSIPDVDFIADEVCSNDTVFFTDTSISTQGVINFWEWDFGDGFPVDYNQNTAHLYGTHGTYNVRLTVATDRGCTNTVVKPQRSFPVPVPNFTQEGVCEKQRVLFTDNSQLDPMFGSVMTSWHWEFGDSSDAMNQTVGHFYQDPGYYTLSLTPYSNYGCHHTESFEILMRPKPEAKILILDDKVCAGTEINYRDETYFDHEFDSIGVVSWRWLFGDSNTSLKPDPSNTFAKGGVYNTLLVTETGYGCIDSTYRNTIVYHNPIADFKIDSAEGCSPHCVTFIDESRLASGDSLTYSWSFGDGNNNFEDVNPTYCYQVQDGTGLSLFQIELGVFSPYGCRDTFAHPERVMIHARPISDFELSATTLSLLEPVVLIDNYSVGADEWLWDFGDSTTSTFPSPNQHEYDAPGTYTIGLTTSTDFGCEDYLEKRIVVEPHQTLYVPTSFTPNGDGRNDFFEIKGEDLEYVKLWIYNRWGDEIFYGENENARWDGYYNGSNLQVGSYAYVIEYRQSDQIKQIRRGNIIISRNDNP